jgi:hypothetical protein
VPRLVPSYSAGENQVMGPGAEFPDYGPHNRTLEQIAGGERKVMDWLAERVGFEPTVEFPQHTLSKRAP